MYIFTRGCLCRLSVELDPSLGTGSMEVSGCVSLWMSTRDHNVFSCSLFCLGVFVKMDTSEVYQAGVQRDLYFPMFFRIDTEVPMMVRGICPSLSSWSIVLDYVTCRAAGGACFSLHLRHSLSVSGGLTIFWSCSFNHFHRCSHRSMLSGLVESNHWTAYTVHLIGPFKHSGLGGCSILLTQCVRSHERGH